MSLIDGEWSVYAATCVGVVVCFFVQMQIFRQNDILLDKADMAMGAGGGFHTFDTGPSRLRHFICHAVLSVELYEVPLLDRLPSHSHPSIDRFRLWQLPKLKDAVYIAMVPLFSIRVVSDAVTAVTLCVQLYDARTGFGRSIKLVNTLIIYAVNRFVLTTVVVIIQTIILIIRPESIWAMVIEFVSVHLYVNSFLATLNSRSHLRGLGSGDTVYDSSSRVRASTIHFASDRSRTSGVPSRVPDNNEDQRPANVDFKHAGSSGMETLVLSEFGGARKALAHSDHSDHSDHYLAV
ncbi:hypothetical protein EW146_g6594 [Bondarzewia mesenterica]|uniref:DUF6534 domain-containing protein n=1 Tax=Bondarzewia mesenterica TaxID=1095465 RepID=A0A4S4LN54_9AGAM|nr:hypothetical protein EW146_g6594 [Bondarzewia mesenterica]